MFSTEDIENQKMETDFVFEPDPRALESILKNRGLTNDGKVTEIKSLGSTPSNKLEFFEGKNGAIFCRGEGRPSRVLGSVNKLLLPAPTRTPKSLSKNLCTANLMTTTTATSRTLGSVNKKNLPPPKRPVPTPSSLKSKDASDPLFRRGDNSEAMSLKQLTEEPSTSRARKGLNFDKENGSTSAVPRESLPLRQSLTMAELDRLFEDDSTCSFEALEKRLKTPKRKTLKEIQVNSGREKQKTLDKSESRKKKLEVEELKGSPAFKAPLRPPVSSVFSNINDQETVRTTTSFKTKLPVPEKYLRSMKEKTSIDFNKTATSETKEFEKSPTTEKETRAKEPDEIDATKDPEKTEEKKVYKKKYQFFGQGKFQISNEDVNDLAESFEKISAITTTTTRTEENESKPKGITIGIGGAIYEDISDVEDEPVLPRSLSCVNLASAEGDGSKEVVLSKSISTSNLHCKDNDDWLKDAKEEIEKYRLEQLEVERQVRDLYEQSRKRREAFKDFWGVSPKNINRLRSKRSMMINDMFVRIKEHEVSFSRKSNEPPMEGESVVFSDNEDDDDEKSQEPVKFLDPTPQEKQKLSPGPKVRVNFPVHVGKVAGSISFNENKSSYCFMNNESAPENPEPKDRRWELTTPMALRHISAKAHQELSMLYEEDENKKALFQEDN